MIKIYENKLDMKRVIYSNDGIYTFKNVMLDLDGSTLEEGVDVYLDDEHIGELHGYHDLGDMDRDLLIELAKNL